MVINAICSHHVVSCLSQGVLVCSCGLLKGAFFSHPRDFFGLCPFSYVEQLSTELQVTSCRLVCRTVGAGVGTSARTGRVLVLSSSVTGLLLLRLVCPCALMSSCEPPVSLHQCKIIITGPRPNNRSCQSFRLCGH